ncbi:MAG: hypothetical protein H0T65_22385 [Deltaproteobacteria bacterium]|nr:hypothetical protein [Deltaproteobacteria bacterium]
MKRVALFLLLCACDRSTPKESPVAVADPKQAAAAHDAKQWKRCAELWLAVAATTKGEAMAAPLYDAACCQAQGGDLDDAFATLDRAIATGLDDPAIQNDPDLAPLRADRRWPALLARVAELRAKSEAAVGNPALRDTLLAMERDDQAAREAEEPQTDGVDARTTEALKAIVAKHGWPGKSLVGKDGAHAAWLIVQHSRDFAFQKQCLEMLEIAVAQGEAQAVEHAYLSDRVAVNEGKPQRWGTQFDKANKPYPIEDVAHVDEWRKAIGLSTLADYERFLRERAAP